MRLLKLWMAIGVLGLAVACSRGMKDKLLGTDNASAESGNDPVTASALSLDDQIMTKAASDISQEILGTGNPSFAAPLAAACVPGTVTYSSNTVTYPPQVQSSSGVYTSGGVTYFSGYYYQSSGGTLAFVREMNGTCLTNSSIYGTLSVQGSSYTQWAAAGTQTQYRYYYYKYTYHYKGDILEISGQYTIGTETGTTVYPIKFTLNI